MGKENQKEKPINSAYKRRPLPNKLGKVIRGLRNEKDLNMGEMAVMLGCSKPYLSQVETGKIPPSLKFLNNYIKTFELEPLEAYNLFITAYEGFNSISIDLNDLRILDREHFSRLLAIVKLFNLVISPMNPEAHNLRNAIDEIWKLNMPK